MTEIALLKMKLLAANISAYWITLKAEAQVNRWLLNETWENQPYQKPRK